MSYASPPRLKRLTRAMASSSDNDTRSAFVGVSINTNTSFGPFLCAGSTTTLMTDKSRITSSVTLRRSMSSRAVMTRSGSLLSNVNASTNVISMCSASGSGISIITPRVLCSEETISPNFATSPSQLSTRDGGKEWNSNNEAVKEQGAMS